MRCYAPFCKTTAETVSASAGVTLHEFPSDSHLRAAWLRALGRQDAPLPDLAVVCSQHFLNDDMYETEIGSMQLRTGAIPSTVQVCMICLDTDSELFLMSKHKLEEAYQHLTGNLPCDLGNLKQTLCVHCAQRLINFSRFRDKSLRARALLMDLVQQYELITRLHIKKINRTRHQLKSNMMVTTLAPDHCDLHILEDIQSEPADTIDTDVVKTEGNDELMLVDEDMEVIQEDDHADSVNEEFVASEHTIKLEAQLLEDAVLNAPNRKAAVCPQVAVTQDIFKCESAPYQCTLCFEEFVLAPAYLQHLSTHLQNGAAAADHQQLSNDPQKLSDDPQQLSDAPRPSADLSPTSVVPWSTSLEETDAIRERKPGFVVTEGERKPGFVVTAGERKPGFVVTEGERKPGFVVSEGELGKRSSDSKCERNTNIERFTDNNYCFVKLYDLYQSRDEGGQLLKMESLTKAVNKYTNFSYETSRQNAVSTTQSLALNSHGVKINNSNIINALKKETARPNKEIYSLRNSSLVDIKLFTCDICSKSFRRRPALVRHMKVHSQLREHSCRLCQYKANSKSALKLHMRTHSGEKPYHCTLCEYKTAQNSHLVVHNRIHTGDKPFSCELCTYRCAQNCSLVKHMRTHTGEKCHSCVVCGYRCTLSSDLARHTRTHTGEKPFPCTICELKFSRKSHLVDHMRTHSGAKPYRCELCDYKCSQRGTLIMHTRKHTGEKPFYCNVCSYKCARNSTLVSHMRTHTGEKPFRCELCEYECSRRSGLALHTRTHAGEEAAELKIK